MTRATADADLIKLYSTQILALASDIPHLGRLDAPQGSVNERAPVCGSTVTVDLVVQDSRISAFAQDVKACALGQASAAVIGRHIVGCSLTQVSAARSQLAAMLEGADAVPDAPFQELEVLKAAVTFRNRHASILLAITATEKAMKQALEHSAA